jgi:hypothetical protein
MPAFNIQLSMVFLGVFGLTFGAIPTFPLHLSRFSNQVLHAGGFLHSRKALKR